MLHWVIKNLHNDVVFGEREYFKDQVIFEENEVLKKDDNPYTVYTPYFKEWWKRFSGTPSLPAFPSEKYCHNFYQLEKKYHLNMWKII